jgi:hypothetical protein
MFIHAYRTIGLVWKDNDIIKKLPLANKGSFRRALMEVYRFFIVCYDVPVLLALRSIINLCDNTILLYTVDTNNNQRYI